MALTGGATLGGAVIAAALSAGATLIRLNRVDPSLVLKEGE